MTAIDMQLGGTPQVPVEASGNGAAATDESAAVPVVAEMPVAAEMSVPAEPALFVEPVAPTPGPSRRPVDTGAAVPPAGPVYRQIAYGTGAGAQPPPDYPIEAQSAGQAGTVVVRFDVGPDGRVVDCRVVVPSPWPLLNDAASQSIRDTWAYPPGPVRRFEVPIVYQPRDRP